MNEVSIFFIAIAMSIGFIVAGIVSWEYVTKVEYTDAAAQRIHACSKMIASVEKDCLKLVAK